MGRAKYLKPTANRSVSWPAPTAASGARSQGYTTLSVADWDGDGLPDVVVNSIWGKWCGSETAARSTPQLAAAPWRWNGMVLPLAYGWLSRRQGTAHSVAHDAGGRRLEP